MTSDKTLFRENAGTGQDAVPLLDALREFASAGPAYFRIPAHRFSRGVDECLLHLLGENVFCADLTEAEGLDDLHAASGVIAEAEKLAAQLWGSEECHFLINGSTCGNEAMLLACLKPGEKILLARNVHKSVLMGLILSGAVPVWIQPEEIPGEELEGPVSAETVRRALCAEPECRAVMLVSPTYYGVCSPLDEIAEVCHARQIPLLVDEAHGSHLYFMDDVPVGALKAGADLVVQSVHKTGGSMTQSSLLHVQGDRIDRNRLRESLALVMSTSPSYVLMASLDGARHQLAMNGRELMQDAGRLAALCRKKLKEIPGIRVFENAFCDPLRVVFSAVACGISGTHLQDLLFRKSRISLELSDSVYVTAVITWGNTEEEINRLINTVREAAVEAGVSENRKEFDAAASAKEILRIRPDVVCTPGRAWNGDKIPLLLESCIGKTAAEGVIPYPPGVPVLYPGERITEEVLGQLLRLREAHVPLHGPADPSLRALRILS